MKIRYASIGLVAVLAAACDSGSAGRPDPVNEPPAIAAVPDQVTTANGAAKPIVVEVADERADTLTLSASSTDQDVVADSGLSIAGAGARRIVTITPVQDATGESLVTLVVTDSVGLSASTSFLFSVRAEQKSMRQFTRSEFSQDADGDPELVNAVDFDRDAEADDFADLLTR